MKAPPVAAPLRICALLACHNRREQTLECLRALAASAGFGRDFDLAAVLVDDGSRDGTAAAVRDGFAWVEVLEADGSLYWCRAMHRAFARALSGRFDAYLWLNDDTVVAPAALATLLASLRACDSVAQPAIVVGTAAHGGMPSYGGRVASSRWRRTAWTLLPPGEAPQRVDTMDGNLVLISAAAAARIGNLDAAFEHAMGDYDYALRARAAGVGVWLAPGVLAQCATNPQAGSFVDANLPLAARWRAMMAPKGLPWRSWARFTRRHAGVAWPLFFAWPYLRVLLGIRVRS